MSAVTESLCCILLLFFCMFSHQETITADSKQNVNLTCQAPNNTDPIIVVEWSRADLVPEYVFVYRNEKLDLENQHPSFKNRVDLRDRQMKDRDVSLILKNVTINDTGIYECHVFMSATKVRLKTKPICNITLRVVPPGQPGGDTEDGGKEDGSVGLKVGLPLLGVLLIAAAVVVF
ncbi:programmed cell death 1 ligand 1-like isoform X1 [Astatotilapia calliptera]|uniref:programmed cell death 1 ligand 1-like isoform X1 n=1 Tax=Astatotilapia calliptera TaxID=8154 RepID=UPI000E417E55|nr:programmed cell death 1 ligand 1-like isoform X1 [Astatotilapia calliptera]XP_026009864.1 programmed cell death 1 ligand 1-like isoform X1 [Astatotilapia calliptera]